MKKLIIALFALFVAMSSRAYEYKDTVMGFKWNVPDELVLRNSHSGGNDVHRAYFRDENGEKEMALFYFLLNSQHQPISRNEIKEVPDSTFFLDVPKAEYLGTENNSWWKWNFGNYDFANTYLLPDGYYMKVYRYIGPCDVYFMKAYSKDSDFSEFDKIASSRSRMDMWMKMLKVWLPRVIGVIVLGFLSVKMMRSWRRKNGGAALLWLILLIGACVAVWFIFHIWEMLLFALWGMHSRGDGGDDSDDGPSYSHIDVDINAV